ncbi:hypothetical protein AJ80_01859 [Polytolypa hystricis UAMH7299]|uniref:Uncharacterized protein n=1 Tax=Polytolypa hystricis (strain UAMH7299) TaxID=1447883 RepID=A0A2B7YYZ0_POLH7|nr:hypothetical protein AJ80_01859 [Polytolypa hystricis UAMH7299]
MHSGNRIIADQRAASISAAQKAVEGPSSEPLTFHEAYAFGDLRAGCRLQWRNLACELHSGALNFNHPETSTLILATIWQVGARSKSYDYYDSFEPHLDLEDEDFGMSLLSSLLKAMESQQGNWQGAESSRTFIAIATRVLSFSTFRCVIDECLEFLRKARQIILIWMRELG